MELTPRKQKLLSMIVERYVATGEPVGSKFLSAMFVTAISSATIRNEMAALSLEGLIEQPYTSAGWVPTPKGYRYFIDHLRPDMELSVQEKFRVDRVLAGQSGEPDSFLDACCSLLSDMTGCTALASTPSGGDAVVTGVQLVKTGTLSVMILLRNSLGVLKSRVILLGSEPDMDDIRLFYSIAANLFIGKQPEKLSKADVQTMAFSLEDRALTMSPLLSALCQMNRIDYAPKNFSNMPAQQSFNLPTSFDLYIIIDGINFAFSENLNSSLKIYDLYKKDVFRGQFLRQDFFQELIKILMTLDESLGKFRGGEKIIEKRVEVPAEKKSSALDEDDKKFLQSLDALAENRKMKKFSRK